MSPDISVIIPTFRRPRELAEALRSVLAQKDVSVEIFVIDDCPDGSAAAAAAPFLAQGVAYLRNPAPSGGRPAQVRNFGWPLARGDLVHFLDDDDIVPSGHYAAAKRIMARNAAVGVVFGAIKPFGAGDVAAEERYFGRAFQRARRFGRFGARFGLAAAMFFGPTLLVCSAAIIRRRCIADLGGFNPELPLVEDVDFYARAIRRFGAEVMNGVSIHYRIGPSLMHQPSRAKLISQSYTMIHSYYRATHSRLDYFALKGAVYLLAALLIC